MATRNRYAELMAQYQQAQPFSFTGYPSTYTGGYDISPYTSYAAPVNKYEEIMAQPTMGSGDRRAIDWNPEWTNLSDEGKAAYYAANPGWAKLTQEGQKIFGITSFGALQKGLVPDFVARQKLIAMGINPATMDYSNEGRNYPAPTGGFVAITPQQAAAEAAAVQAAEQAAAAQAATQIDTTNYSNEGRSGGGGGGAISGGGGMLSSQSSDTRAALRSNEGYGGNSSSSNYKGGPISMHNLHGPDPMGPDDGYASLKDGEYVINDKAVKKYGIELMNAINSGKISKGKLRGLLEM
jgi:hypothetical protein